MEKPTASEDSFTQMVTFTRENGKMTRRMATENTHIWMEPSIQGSGPKTSNMERETRKRQTERSMMVIS